jgi:DNA-binding NarL/FixJ family response regulator
MSLCSAIILVDDHAAVRAGYRRFIDCEHDLKVVGEAGNSEQAYELLRQQDCDVLVLDISLPGQSGLDLIKRVLIKWPKLKVLVLSMHDSPVIAEKAIGLGAKGYVTKSSDPDELVLALRSALGGKTYISKDIEVQQQKSELSARETDVVRLLLEGKTIDQAAELLGISSKTVSNNLSQIRQKLGLQTDFELASWAWSKGLGPAPPQA